MIDLLRNGFAGAKGDSARRVGSTGGVVVRFRQIVLIDIKAAQGVATHRRLARRVG